MKYLYIVIAIAAVLMIIGACKGTKKSSAAVSAKSPSIQLTKGKCFGRCKTYTFSLFDDHSASFVGEKNVEFIGAHHAHISSTVYNELVAQLSAAELESMDDEYLSTAKDLAEIELSFKDKTIRFHNRKAPDALRDMVKMLDEIAFSQRWGADK